MTSETQEIPERKNVEDLKTLGITEDDLSKAISALEKQDAKELKEAREKGLKAFWHHTAHEIEAVNEVLLRFQNAKAPAERIRFLRTVCVLHEDYSPPTMVDNHEIGQLHFDKGTAEAIAVGIGKGTFSYYYDKKE